MVFTWTADREVYFDMHAEPAGLGEEYAESFEQGNDTYRTGSFHALLAAFMVGFGKIEAAALLRFASMPQDFL
jgi:hypothetical protein